MLSYKTFSIIVFNVLTKVRPYIEQNNPIENTNAKKTNNPLGSLQQASAEC